MDVGDNIILNIDCSRPQKPAPKLVTNARDSQHGFRPLKRRLPSGDSSEKLQLSEECKFPKIENSPIAERSPEALTSPSSNRKMIGKGAAKVAAKIRTGFKSTKLSDNLLKIDEITEADRDFKELMTGQVPAKLSTLFASENFQEFGLLHEHIVACLSQRFNIERMTAIQKVAMPSILSKRDCLIKAQTGSGKTLAYAVPLLQDLIARKPEISRSSGLTVLVVTPTRELATQTHACWMELCQAAIRIVPGCLTGGAKIKSEKMGLRKGWNIITCTPQRLLEHIRRTTTLDFTSLDWLVLDEADRMLEMGYEKAVRDILDTIRSQSVNRSFHTILVSATLTSAVQKLACLSMQDAVLCAIKATVLLDNQSSVTFAINQPLSTESTALDEFDMPAGLQHYVLVVPTKLKLIALIAFLLVKCQHGKHGGKVVIFLSTQSCVDYFYALMRFILTVESQEECAVDLPIRLTLTQSLRLFRLHGNVDHKERQETFSEFNAANSAILFCTDVASRGLDMPRVSWVIQYHPPLSPVDYVHRVGRTARAGGKGRALLLLAPEEADFAGALEAKLTEVREQPINSQKSCALMQRLSLTSILKSAFENMLQQMQKRKQKKKSTEEDTTLKKTINLQYQSSQLQNQLEKILESDSYLQELGCSAYLSFVRSYASFSTEQRKYFAFHKLHLGHAAKSFALSETPKEIGEKMRNLVKDRRAVRKEASSKRVKSTKGTDRNLKKDFSKPRRKRTVNIDHAEKNMMAEFQ